ncbi:DUF4148 domain-containing protein [Piscinibacter sakaiensis]|nr:DUF4148 domain-containing protein [Piscinibacter sakaiensis]
MNAKTLIAAATLAIVGTCAFANEVTEFPAESTAARATVVADLQQARHDGSLAARDEAYGSVDAADAAARPARVFLARIQASQPAAARTVRVDPRTHVMADEAYGSVEPSSVRSRADVRAETLAALRK